MTIQFQQVEPLNDLHHDKIIAAFNELFINWGGQSDGDGFGYDYGNGDGGGCGCGYGDIIGDGEGVGWGNGKPPEEWRAE